MPFEDVWFTSDRRVPPSGSEPESGDSQPATMLATPVLVIEDESLIAWMIEDILTDVGFTTIAIVASGQQALDQARRIAPGLIVSDVNLGKGEDGVETVRAIRQWCPAPAVFVTGYADATIRERIERDLGGAQLLRKPVDRKALIAAVMRALGN